MKNVIKTSPDIQILDPVSGQLRNKSSGQVYKVSIETLQLIAFFEKPKDVGENLDHVQNLFETDDAESLKVFIRGLIQRGILVDSEKDLSKDLSQLIISDIALVEKPPLSCLSLPIANLDSEYSYEYAIVGTPFDLGTTGYPGARFGPTRLRELSSVSTDYRASLCDMSCDGWYSDHGRKLCSGKKIVDIGDVIHNIGEQFSSFYKRAEKTFDRLRKRGSMPIIIGGDHSCLYPAIISASKVALKPLHLVVFDAHTDLADYDHSISHNHGNVISRILSEGLIKRLTHIGLRGMVGKVNTQENCTQIYSHQCINDDLILKIMNICADEDLYISLDIDSIDPVFAPGTGTPVPFGLNPVTVLSCICKLLNSSNVLGFDIFEYNPMRDTSDLTGNLIIHMLPVLLDSIRSNVD